MRITRNDPAYRYAIKKGLPYKIIRGRGVILSPSGKPVDAWEYYRKNTSPISITVPKKIKALKEAEAPKEIIKIETPKEIESPEPPKINLFKTTPTKLC